MPEAVIEHTVTHPTFTERQAKAWTETVILVLARHGIDADQPERSHQWTLTWAEETRPGRGHALDATFIDGESFAQVTMDVYGYPSIAVALLTWVHSDADEESDCEDCPTDDGTDDEE